MRLEQLISLEVKTAIVRLGIKTLKRKYAKEVALRNLQQANERRRLQAVKVAEYAKAAGKTADGKVIRPISNMDRLERFQERAR